jgi:uncharacterized protein (DUF58 family)
MSDVALSPELFARLKLIQVRTRHLVTDMLAGDYASAFKGRGMEFDEVREYQPGDDIRHIDWNVTARMNAPFVKVHKEERELTVMVLVDVSSSGLFGSTRALKREVAAEAAAILAYTAVQSNDRVGLVVFGGDVETYIPAAKGTGHVWRVIREILGYRKQGRQSTNLAGALAFLGRVQKRRAVVFVISDFLDQDYADPLKTVAARHDVTAVTITDPREVALPAIGLIELEDAETGERILVDTSSSALTGGFAGLGERERRARQDLFRSSGVGHIDVRTNSSTVDAVVRYLRMREHHRRR